jgi:hypothetical protein
MTCRAGNNSPDSTVPFDYILGRLKEFPPLNPRQVDNVSRLLRISEKFSKRAGICSTKTESVTPDTIILESGHQPNFLSHSGTYKKGFLLSWVQDKLQRQGESSIAFFGLADQNLSTAKLLHKNRIPAFNKEGFEAIGFRIDEVNRLKAFSTLAKPTAASWELEISRIKKYYLDNQKKLKGISSLQNFSIDTILEILWKSYTIAENFADLNCIIFAKISRDILGTDLRFYRYSDLQNEGLFIDESIGVLKRLSEYNTLYNRISHENGIPVPAVTMGHVPFWYHCCCGTKLELVLDNLNNAPVHCPACNQSRIISFGEGFEHLPEFYPSMDFNAVSRSVIVAEGLGDSLFVPGSGGSLAYGKITAEISRALSTRNPAVLAWRSADFYLGLAHELVLDELAKNAGCSLLELTKPGATARIRNNIQQITDRISIAESDNTEVREIKMLKNNLNNLTNTVATAKKIFNLVPSVIDILVATEPHLISALWNQNLRQGNVTLEGEVFLLKSDVLYPSVYAPDISPDVVPELYQMVRKDIGVKE